MRNCYKVKNNILNYQNKFLFKIYENFYNDRKKLYKEFKGDKKGYIYVIINKLNGKCYVGSTRSIVTRLYNYFNLNLFIVLFLIYILYYIYLIKNNLYF